MDFQQLRDRQQCLHTGRGPPPELVTCCCRGQHPGWDLEPRGGERDGVQSVRRSRSEAYLELLAVVGVEAVVDDDRLPSNRGLM